MEDGYLLTPLSPTGSLLRGWRPSLAALFHQFRGSSDRDYLVKEDFSEVFIDASQLDKAFEVLDSDGNGRITLDEFMAGFATFLRQSQSSCKLPPSTETDSPPLQQNEDKKGFRIRRSVRRRPIPEIFFETTDNSSNNNDDKQKPTETFKTSLKPLPTRTQENIEQLWCNLNNNNPELVQDFEDFICEMSTEVDSAQKALKKQREVNNKEALELDVEMERLQNHTQTRLQHETAVLREKAQNHQFKLTEQLQEKEEELSDVKSKLKMLESEIVSSRQQKIELEQKCETALMERNELMTKLETSESKLTAREQVIASLRKEANENEQKRKSMLEEQEVAMAQLEFKYTKDINELKEKLSTAVTHTDELQYHPSSNISEDNIKPDLLHTHQGRGASPCSLLDEIVQSEGTSSPAFKNTMIHVTPTTPSTSLWLRPPPSAADSDNEDELAFVDYRDVEHLDLASLSATAAGGGTNDVPQQPNVVRLRSNATSGRARPSSLYATRPENMDLNWPPGHWVVPPQEWLAAIAAATITSTKLDSSPQQEPTPVTNELMRLESKHEKFTNPEMCKPLDFIGGLVVQPDMTFKVLIVGNPHVGKTCYLMKLCTNNFTTRYASTIGVDLYNRVLKVDNKTIMLQLWDTAGQERFQSVTRAYYRGAHGVILMYDITREESFIAVRTWVNSIQENMGEFPSVLLLVGNKVDLDETGKREVLSETGETFAKIYGAHFIETSAKCGYNVANSCLTLVHNLILENKMDSQSVSNSVDITEKQKRCFC